MQTVEAALGALDDGKHRAEFHRMWRAGYSRCSIVASLDGCPHLTPDFALCIETSEKTGDFAPLSRLAELYEDGFR